MQSLPLKAQALPQGRKRWWVALGVAALSDAIALPAHFAPPLQMAIDLLTAVALVAILGWRWAYIAAIVPEAIPGMDVFPAWIMVIGSLAVLENKKLKKEDAALFSAQRAVTAGEKVLERWALAQRLKELKAQGKKIVFTNGVFDLLHTGHLRYLQQASSLGDCLVIGLNSDASVRQLKGPQRPILPQEERAELLAGLACVSYVCVFEELDPRELIKALRPNVLVKGGDWPVDKILGADTVQADGGQVLSLPFVPGRSTTSIVESILQRYRDGFKE